MTIRKVLLFLLISFASLSVGAQSSKVKQLEKKRGRILLDIEKTNKSLERVKRSGIEEKKRLELVKQRVIQRKEVISVIGQEMDALNEQIDSLNGKIRSLRAQEARLLSQYEMSTRVMYRHELIRKKLLYLLSSETIDDLRIRQKVLSKYAKSTRRLAQELRQNKKNIETAQTEVNLTYQKKNEALQLHSQEQKKLEEEQGKHQVNIQKLKGQEQSLERELHNQAREAEKLDAQIQAQIQAEIAAANRRAKKAEELRIAKERRARRERNKRSRDADKKTIEREKEKVSQEEQRKEVPNESVDTESETKPIRGGYAMDGQDIKLSGSFAQNKGRLPLPVRGRYELISRFGKRPHHKFKSLMVHHSGIELKVYSDKGAYSVFDGVVMHIFVASGYGQGVLLRHGNYFTVYVNLSSVSVRSGQKVAAGTRLGTINGDQSSPRANVLHFQLRHNDNKLNPEQWIKKL